ncbi:MAG: MFS transporter [Anaerolineae bacterium]|nr:MFS transporter [Anaerolineae bacterium]
MPQWRRTLYTVWFTQFIAVTGFAFVMPFIPYYVQQLGVTDIKEAGLWAGLVTSAQAVSMALMAPVWGALSDRYGRKLMVMRASFAGAVVMTMMGFVTNVQQLLVLRFVQGIFTGTVSATTTLVASTVPRERSGMALGSLQTAVFLGVSLGPLLGGVTGDAFGYRPSFWITGGLLFISGVLVAIFVHEGFQPAKDVVQDGRGGYGKAVQSVLASGGLLALFATRILLRIGSNALGPVLPLFVQTLLPPGAPVATTAGIIAGASALGSAVGSPLIGRWGDQIGHRRLLVISALAAALCILPQGFMHNTWSLLVWQVLSGFALGGTLSTLTALLARSAPEGHQGIVFGLDASALSGANAIGPLTGAAVAAALGLRAPFVLAAGLLVIGLAPTLLWVRSVRHRADAHTSL